MPPAEIAQGAMGGTQGTMGRTRGWMGRRGEVSGAPAVFGGISVRGVLRVLENKIYIFAIHVFRSLISPDHFYSSLIAFLWEGNSLRKELRSVIAIMDELEMSRRCREELEMYEEAEFDVETQQRLDCEVDKLLKGYDWTLSPLANK